MRHFFDVAQNFSVFLELLSRPRLEVAVRAPHAADVRGQPVVNFANILRVTFMQIFLRKKQQTETVSGGLLGKILSCK